MGWHCKRQPKLYQCRILDTAYRSSLERSALILWEMGNRSSEIPQMEKRRYMGKDIGGFDK